MLKLNYTNHRTVEKFEIENYHVDLVSWENVRTLISGNVDLNIMELYIDAIHIPYTNDWYKLPILTRFLKNTVLPERKQQ